MLRQFLTFLLKYSKEKIFNLRGEGDVDTAKSVLKYCICPVLAVVDGVLYFVNCHYRAKGKGVSESMYRLMERDLNNSTAATVETAIGDEVK